MKIIETKIDSLIPADYNPRELTKKQYQDLKDSLTEFGFVDPVIANEARKNIIIGGHQRVRVWKDMGHDTAPVHFLTIPSLEKEQELNVRLNKNTGQFDIDKLANFFDQDKLLKWGFEKHEFGIDEIPYEETEGEDDIPETAITSTTDANDGVLDFFLGSGSTLIACEKTDRKCYGMELDPKYCDVIVKRYVDYCKKNNKPYSVKRNGEECNDFN